MSRFPHGVLLMKAGGAQRRAGWSKKNLAIHSHVKVAYRKLLAYPLFFAVPVP